MINKSELFKIGEVTLIKLTEVMHEYADFRERLEPNCNRKPIDQIHRDIEDAFYVNLKTISEGNLTMRVIDGLNSKIVEVKALIG